MRHALSVLKKRKDFLACARGRRWSTPGFLLQGRPRGEDAAQPGDARIGFTCSKKVGNAVMRNRAKRRLREIARAVLPDHVQPGWDYVLVGFADTTISRPFDKMTRDLTTAVERVHQPRRKPAGKNTQDSSPPA